MSIEAFEKFEKSWLEEIAKIENRAIDSEGVYLIYLKFRQDVGHLSLVMTDEEMDKVYNEIDILDSKLTVALETARSKFRLQNFGLWARVAEGVGGMIYRIPKSQPVKSK